MADNFSRIRDIIEESEQTRSTTTADKALIAADHADRPNRARSQMMSVRIPLDAASEIEQLAAKHDVPVSSLVRGWILDGLATQSMSMPRSLDKIEAEVARLRGLIK